MSAISMTNRDNILSQSLGKQNPLTVCMFT